MEFVHYDVGHLQTGSVVEVTLDSRANVRLLDEPNFRTYTGNGRYRYYGGEAVHSPVRLQVPHSGHWHVAIDLGGGSGQIRSSVNVTR
jgi:hypothetical protein